MYEALLAGGRLRRRIAYTTVKTYLDRLVRKGYVHGQPLEDGRGTYEYTADVDEATDAPDRRAGRAGVSVHHDPHNAPAVILTPMLSRRCSMVASHCAHCGQSFPHPPRTAAGQRLYTPMPEGFERFLRESVGHPGIPPRLIRAPDVGTLFRLPVGRRQGEPTDDAGTMVGQGAASMRNRYAIPLCEDDGAPTWRPQPGEVLAGVIDRYTVSETPQGFVRTVIVTEEQTGEQVSVQLASTSLLALFAEQQPHPRARIEVRYRWQTLGHGYQRWRLLTDRPVPLELSPLGGEASDEASWHREWRGATAVAGSAPHRQAAV
jgi:hypothetical protein